MELVHGSGIIKLYWLSHYFRLSFLMFPQLQTFLAGQLDNWPYMSGIVRTILYRLVCGLRLSLNIQMNKYHCILFVSLHQILAPGLNTDIFFIFLLLLFVKLWVFLAIVSGSGLSNSFPWPIPPANFKAAKRRSVFRLPFQSQ